MRKLPFLFLVAFFALFLAGCIAPQASGGATSKVTDKTHTAAYTSMVYDPAMPNVFTPVKHSESWKLRVETCSGQDCSTADVEVSKDVYDATSVGDIYTASAATAAPAASANASASTDQPSSTDPSQTSFTIPSFLIIGGFIVVVIVVVLFFLAVLLDMGGSGY